MVRGLHLEIKYFFIIHVLKLLRLHLVLCFIARYVTAIVCLLLYAGNKLREHSLALSLNSLLFTQFTASQFIDSQNYCHSLSLNSQFFLSHPTLFRLSLATTTHPVYKGLR